MSLPQQKFCVHKLLPCPRGSLRDDERVGDSRVFLDEPQLACFPSRVHPSTLAMEFGICLLLPLLHNHLVTTTDMCCDPCAFQKKVSQMFLQETWLLWSQSHTGSLVCVTTWPLFALEIAYCECNCDVVPKGTHKGSKGHPRDHGSMSERGLTVGLERK